MRLEHLEELSSSTAAVGLQESCEESVQEALRAALPPQEAQKYTATDVKHWVTSWRSSDPFGIAKEECGWPLHPSKLLFLHLCCEQFALHCCVVGSKGQVAKLGSDGEGVGQFAILVTPKEEFVAWPSTEGLSAAGVEPSAHPKVLADSGRMTVCARPEDSESLITSQSYEFVLQANELKDYTAFAGPTRTLLGAVFIQPTRDSQDPMMPAPDAAMVYVNVHEDELRMVIHVHECTGLKIESSLRNEERLIRGFVKETRPPVRNTVIVLQSLSLTTDRNSTLV